MKLFSKNWVEDATITVSTGDTSKGNMKDRNTATVWASVGSTDLITETIVVEWAATRRISRVCFRAFNFKQYTVQYWNGAAYVDFSTPINETVNASTSKFHSFTEVSTLKVQVTCLKTIAVDAQKQIGEFMLYYEHVDLGETWMPDRHDVIKYLRKSEHEKASGGNVLIYEATATKFQATFEFDNLKETYMNTLLTLKTSLQSFWVQPYQDSVVEQYYVNWTSDFNFRRVLAWDNISGERCYAGSMEVKEV